MMNNKVPSNVFVLCGMAADLTGVGRLCKHLESVTIESGWRFIYRREVGSARHQILKGKLLYGLRIGLSDIWKRFYFFLFVSLVKNRKLVVVHPQTVGFRNVARLSQRNNVNLYLMDNSFFCMMSYNLNPVTESECFICLHDRGKVIKECTPRPLKQSKAKFSSELDEFYACAAGIRYLAQTQGQASMVKKAFGSVEVEVVGLSTGEEKKNVIKFYPSAPLDIGVRSFCVYHGATSKPKGIGFFIKIAESLPGYTFVVPDSKENVSRCLGRELNAENIVYFPCTWETGLDWFVSNARLVINPSLWSAPIEGALLKSIAYNGCVAVVESDFGFEKELQHIYGLIRLPRDIEKATLQIANELKNTTAAQHDLNTKIVIETFDLEKFISVVEQ